MPLSGYEKAAIFLGTLGEDVAAEVLKGLQVTDVGKISRHITRLKTVNKVMIDDVFKEVTDWIAKGNVHLGGEEFIKKVLYKGFGEDGASTILELASKESLLDALRRVDPQTLVNFLVVEHPQTIALMICLLEPFKAADVLALLPQRIQADVSMRIASIERIPESAIEELIESLKDQLDMSKDKVKKIGGTKTIAEILNHCDWTTEQMILEKIEECNYVLADSIRQLMLVFDDLVHVDNKGIQVILKEITKEDLALALKTASEALKEKIFKNMSRRAVEIMKDEMQMRGPVRVSNVEKAQQNIVKIARKLEAEGKIVISERGGENLVE